MNKASKVVARVRPVLVNATSNVATGFTLGVGAAAGVMAFAAAAAKVAAMVKAQQVAA